MSNSIITIIAIAAIAYSGVLRLSELLLSNKNQKKLNDLGFDRKDKNADYLIMVSMHSLFFVALIFEYLFYINSVSQVIQILAIIVFTLSQGLRFFTIRTLGKYWNTNIMSSQDNKVFVQDGPYKYIRHPNYCAIILEFLSLPLTLGAWRTAIIFSIFNALVLFKRIKQEEGELFKIPGYMQIMGSKKRFIPGLL